MVRNQNKEIDHLFLYLAFGLLILFIIVLVWRLPNSSTTETFINPTSNIQELGAEIPYKSNGNLLVLETDLSSKLGENNIVIINQSSNQEVYYQYKVLSVKHNDGETIIQLDKPIDLTMTGKLGLYKVIENGECVMPTETCFNKNNEVQPGLCYDLKTRNTLSTICDYENDDCSKPDYVYQNNAYYLRGQGLTEECILKNGNVEEEIIQEQPLQSQKSITPKTFINQQSDLPADMKQFAFEKTVNKSKDLQIGRNKGIDIEEIGDILDIDDSLQENLEMNGDKPKKVVKVNPNKTKSLSRNVNLDSMNLPSQIILNIGYNNKTENRKPIEVEIPQNDKNQPSILPFMMDGGFNGRYENYDAKNKNEMNTQNKPFQFGNSYANIDTSPEEVLPGMDLTPLAAFEPLD